jgi:hypothetical protein
LSLPITGSPLKADILGPLITETADPVGEGRLAFQVTSFLFIKSGDYDDQGERRYLPSGDRTTQFATAFKPVYGLTDRMDLFAEIPLILNWARQSGLSSQEGGLGDLLLGVKYRFLNENPDDKKPSLTGVFKIHFPTGKYDALSPAKLETDRTGSGSYGLYAAVILGKTWKTWALNFNLGYNWMSETSFDGRPTKPGDLWYSNLAAEWSFSRCWSLIGELTGWVQGKTRENGRDLSASEAYSTALILAVGCKLHEKCFVLTGLSLPLWGRNAAFGLMPGLLVNYSF